MNNNKHKSKIICTIGPATSSLEMLEQLLNAGMNIARLNFSHGEFSSHREIIQRLKQASENTGYDYAIMADLPGPKIRIGKLAEEPIQLQKSQQYTLTTDKIIGDQHRVSVNFDNLPSVVNIDDELFLNDGLISLIVTSTSDSDIVCTIKAGGELRSGKGVDLPGINLGISAFTARDHECLEFALNNGIGAVSQSFVSTANDVLAVRKAANELGYNPFIIAKIERAAALDNIDDILNVTDGIMVARGDLGVEIPISRMAIVQKMLMTKANDYARPVITATQMLESMTEHSRPTRAESTDVANAILDGTDAVMLSAESAIGRYPVESVQMLSDIAIETEQYRSPIIRRTADERCNFASLIANNVQQTSSRLNPSAIITPTRTGAAARNIAKYRLKQWITAFTTEKTTVQALHFSYGVNPILVEEEYEDWSQFIKKWLRSKGITSGAAILTQGPSPEHPNANQRMDIIDLSQ